MRYIGVIDCNNFFVSCERLFRPDLQGKPVIVLSSNDGCVVARSQEVKDMGVTMGVPLFQIKDIIKDNAVTCFSSHFALYRDISARVMSVVKEQMARVEVYSIDEAFFTGEVSTIEELTTIARELKRVVEQCVGIPVSVGISDTKTRAKLVNTIAKKSNGIAMYLGEDFTQAFADTPLRSVWGVGSGSSRQYNSDNIQTIHDLVTTNRARLEKLAGIVGLRLQQELSGSVAYPVTTTVSYPQSLTSTRSFSTKLFDLLVIKDSVAHHVRHVLEDLRSQGLVASALSVELRTSRHGDWSLRGGVRRVDLAVPSDNTADVLKVALKLIDSLYESGVPYSKSGVVVSGLIPKGFVPRSLFASMDEENTSLALDSVVDDLNNRFGKQALRLGVFAIGNKWQSKQETLSQAYTTQWNQLAVAKA